MDGQRSLEIEAMVDTGASYTIVPTNLLNDLGVQAIDKISLTLADGRRAEYDEGRAWATINGASEVTLVVFGENDARALLGATRWKGCAWRSSGQWQADSGHHRLGVDIASTPLLDLTKGSGNLMSSVSVESVGTD